MRRVLSPEERALWRRVTADIRVSGGGLKEEPRKIAPSPVREVEPLAPTEPTARTGPAAPSAQSARRRGAAPARPQLATLDGKWDRDLRTGKVVPDRIVDLHGSTLAQAHDHVLSTLERSIAAGDRLVVIVTGRAPAAGTSRLDRPLRGIIRASITDWLLGARFAGQIAAIRPAHARHGGAGALYVVLRRQGRFQI